jgi:hypothetical protein
MRSTGYWNAVHSTWIVRHHPTSGTLLKGFRTEGVCTFFFCPRCWCQFLYLDCMCCIPISKLRLLLCCGLYLIYTCVWILHTLWEMALTYIYEQEKWWCVCLQIPYHHSISL